MSFKNKISLTRESVLVLFQEVYNELLEQKNLAFQLQNRIYGMMKTAEDVITLTPIFEKQQKVINDIIEKKISLSKIQSNLWGKQKSGDGEGEDINIGDLDPKLLEDLMSKHDESDNVERYKLK